jgi:hypothetical protein
MEINVECPACGCKDKWKELCRYTDHQGNRKISYICECGHTYVKSEIDIYHDNILEG